MGQLEEIKARLKAASADELRFAAAHVDADAHDFITHAPEDIEYLLSLLDTGVIGEEV